MMALTVILEPVEEPSELLEELEAWEAEGRTLLQELQSRSIPESALSAECRRLIELLNG